MRHEKKQEKKRRKKKYLIFAIVLLSAAGVFLRWYLTGGFLRPVTMQIADEDYREGNVRYARREEYAEWRRGVLTALPKPDVNMGFDLRSFDISHYDLRDQADLLSQVTFDSATSFPDKLPEGFSPEEIMELGMYALCLQVDAELTPEEFVEKSFETGTVQTIEYQGKQYELGTIIDPAALIEALK